MFPLTTTGILIATCSAGGLKKPLPRPAFLISVRGSGKHSLVDSISAEMTKVFGEKCDQHSKLQRPTGTSTTKIFSGPSLCARFFRSPSSL